MALGLSNNSSSYASGYSVVENLEGLKDTIQAEKLMREHLEDDIDTYRLNKLKNRLMVEYDREKEAAAKILEIAQITEDKKHEFTVILQNKDKKARKKELKEFIDNNNIKLKHYKKYLKELERAENDSKASAAKQAADLVSSQKGLLGKFGIASGKTRTKQMAMFAERGITGAEADSLRRKANFNALTKAAGNFLQQMNGDIKSIADMKSVVDTRLQGLNFGSRSDVRGALDKLSGKSSIWDNMSKDISSAIGVSPLVKQSAVTENIKNLVSQGIAYNVEERAFLETVKDRVASTFSAHDGVLLRLVRIQQQDTTAARLGMESALTSFLNNMYETSEYMQSVANQVRSSLLEAESMMGAESAAAFEYQVQKWMGSLYSTGMSESGVQGISNVLGQIAAGQIDSLNGSGAGNLLIMAAGNAGKSISDILTSGLTDTETNDLMSAMVEYLADIYNETKDNNVVQQQYAKVFGLTASDLKAAASLQRSNAAIKNQNLTYAGMNMQLNNMLNSLYSRTSVGAMLDNSLGNLKYTMAGNIANSPALYGTYMLSQMLKDTTGGIAIPALSVLGTGTDLETTVSDLMNVGVLGGSILGSLGSLISSFSNGGGKQAVSLENFRRYSSTTVARGNGSNLLSIKGQNVSESGGMMGNEAGDDIKNKTISDAANDANEQLEEQEDQTQDVKIKDVNDNVILIYRLLQDVSNGSKTLKVAFDDRPIAWS